MRSATTSDEAWRPTASTRAASEVTTLCPTSNGAWLRATRLSPRFEWVMALR